MTVRELIAELEKYDDNFIVEIYVDDDYTNDVKTVYEDNLDEDVVIITNS